MKKIFITATNTDIGKTYAAEKFINHYSKKGYKVGYFKPFETAVEDFPLDGSKMLNIVKNLNENFKNITIDDVVPYQFKLPASVYVAKGKKQIDISYLKSKIEYLEKYCDILIIEGAGGLLVPIEKDYFIIDLIKEFNTKTILVGPSKLGCINDILLSCEALKNRNIDYELFINLYQDKDSFEKVSKPFLQEYFKTLNFLDDLN